MAIRDGAKANDATAITIAPNFVEIFIQSVIFSLYKNILFFRQKNKTSFHKHYFYCVFLVNRNSFYQIYRKPSRI
jgi:hypothetical protein